MFTFIVHDTKLILNVKFQTKVFALLFEILTSHQSLAVKKKIFLVLMYLNFEKTKCCIKNLKNYI